MRPKNTRESNPDKEQLRKITWLVGDDRMEGDFIGDVVYLVQVYVTQTNRKIMEMQKQVARLEADLKEAKDALTRVPTVDKTGG